MTDGPKKNLPNYAYLLLPDNFGPMAFALQLVKLTVEMLQLSELYWVLSVKVTKFYEYRTLIHRHHKSTSPRALWIGEQMLRSILARVRSNMFDAVISEEFDMSVVPKSHQGVFKALVARNQSISFPDMLKFVRSFNADSEDHAKQRETLQGVLYPAMTSYMTGFAHSARVNNPADLPSSNQLWQLTTLKSNFRKTFLHNSIAEAPYFSPFKYSFHTRSYLQTLTSNYTPK